jgi:hypothetical protein
MDLCFFIHSSISFYTCEAPLKGHDRTTQRIGAMDRGAAVRQGGTHGGCRAGGCRCGSSWGLSRVITNICFVGLPLEHFFFKKTGVSLTSPQ